MKIFTIDDLYDMTRKVNNVILLDLDGTLARQNFPGPIGEPNPDVVSAVAAARKAGKTVIVWSCRFNQQYVDKGRLAPGQLAGFFVWANRHQIHLDGVLALEKPICWQYWGDECVNVEDL